MRHTENVRAVGGVSAELTGNFHMIEIEFTTMGGIKKLLRVPEAEASWLCAALADALASRPEETRATTFAASVSYSQP